MRSPAGRPGFPAGRSPRPEPPRSWRESTRIGFVRIRFTVSPGLLLLFLIAFPRVPFAHPQDRPLPAVSMQLGDLQVVGMHRYTAEEVTKVSALEIGNRVSIPDLDAAAERMAKTGLFKKVSYRWSATEDRLVVTFEIQESD